MELIKQVTDLKFRLNLTEHLANTQKIFQTGTFYMMSWPEICSLFVQYFHTNFKDEKDTYGFSFGDFKTYTMRDWRLKLYQEYLSLDEKLASGTLTESRKSKVEFKWNKLNTENKRLACIAEMFPDGVENGFHRLSSDCINKTAIIIDYDNNDVVEGTNSKTGKREMFFHYKHPAKSEKILCHLEGLGCNYIAYSSFSSSENKEKFRVIIPVDCPIDQKNINPIKETIINLMNMDCSTFETVYGIIDPTSFEMSRMFYMPVNKTGKDIHKEYKYDSYEIPTNKPDWNCGVYQKMWFPDCWISFLNSDNYLSLAALHEYRHKSIKRGSWKSLDYINQARKNLTF